MKSSISYSLLLAAAACGVAVGQTTAYTTPVGYVTKTLSPNKYNLVSVTLQNPTVSAGVVASATSNSVTVTGAAYSSLLAAGQTYILELADGTIQEVTAWTDTVLSTPENISSKITPGATAFKLRKAATVSSVFGATNSAGLKADGDEDYSNNDLILIPNAAGAFDTVYYFDDGADTHGWFDAEGNIADDRVINYSDGIFVQRDSGSDISLVISGEIKTTPTKSVLASGYNFLGSVSPVGLTLGSSQLSSFLTIATNEEEAASIADIVLQQQESGSYRSAYYFDDGAGTAGWFDSEGNTAEDMVLDSGFLIQNKGLAKSFTVAVPAAYSTL
jgi:hypothetical protein